MLFVLGLVLINFAFIYSEENEIYKITQVAWFEITIKDYYGAGKNYQDKFSIGLFGDLAPMTVLNFASLTKGYKTKSKKLHYRGTKIHRVVKDFVIQMGDVLNGDGTGGMSIYGPKFDDENFILSHRNPGWVSMANFGPDSNSSQFFILLTKARWLDGKHVVFGKVIKGFNTVSTIGEAHVFGDTSTPAVTIEITDCGIETLERPYTMKSSDLNSTEDIQI